jgi:hypothetical protein
MADVLVSQHGLLLADTYQAEILLSEQKMVTPDLMGEEAGSCTTQITYTNRVWDTQAGPAFVRWDTVDFEDSTGASYPGPGTWGVHTSDYCVVYEDEEVVEAPSAIRRDSSVNDHNITTHAETFFHVAGDGVWDDQLGNLIMDRPTDGLDLYSPGVAADTVSGFFTENSGFDTYHFSTAGDFDYTAGPGIGDFTIACLFRTPPGCTFLTNGYFMTVKNSSAGGNYGLSIGTGTSNRARGVWRTPVILNSANDALDDNNWHHIAMTASGTISVNDWDIDFFVDGVNVANLDNQAYMTSITSEIRLHIATFAGTDTFPIRGQARSFIGIRKALSGAEVLQLKVATIG